MANTCCTGTSRCLPQEDCRVDVHPLYPSSRAVLGSQEIVDFTPLYVFSGYTPQINISEYEDLVDLFPKTRKSLGDFALAGLEMHQKTGLIPDASGLHNVVISARTEDILVIGGLPLSQAEESVQVAKITSQLHQLHSLSSGS